ncbi:MAG: hypothetical protein JW699_07010 [Chitinispirillaceae bacterium]|nr:hypothetical protein [Chitinispirillaceae bacterium]
MRKLIISSVIACVMLLAAAAQAQVYNTAQKLKGGTFRLCTAPLLIVDRSNINAGLYLLGGVGVTRIMDLYLHTRVAGSDLANFGVDLQWALIKGTPALSLSTGAHVGPEIGIDGTLDMAFPVGNSVVLYGGLDMDIDFTPGDIMVPAWVFIGPRVQIRRNTTLFMEVDIGVTLETPSILGLGFSFYL